MGMNGTMMQYFEWFLLPGCKLWREIEEEAPILGKLGITALWLPPAYKGFRGKDEVGYAVYDVYDLGEFDQKGSISTKYGTKEQYINAIKKLRGNGIEVYADIVLNHKMGADETEEVFAIQDDINDRKISRKETTIIPQ